jgi:ATP-dependent Clp protease ATP-binding subunit ClpA
LGYDPDFGARPMARTVQTELADELLFGRLARGGAVTADRGEDGLVFRFADA